MPPLRRLPRCMRLRCSEHRSIEATTPSGLSLRSGEVTVEHCRIGIQVTDRLIRLGIGGTTGFGSEPTVFRNNIGGQLTLSDFSIITSGDAGAVAVGQNVVVGQTTPTRKLGRNEPCYCGSRKKYKRR